MAERDFRYLKIDRLLEKGEIIKYRYAVGTPMGALGSFPAGLAFTHHCVVQECARRAGYTSFFDKYQILGDDIVLWDPLVAKIYKSCLEKELCVTISLPKSIIGFGSFEFGKMIVSHGQVVTPIPWRAIKESRSHKLSGGAFPIFLDLSDR